MNFLTFGTRVLLIFLVFVMSRGNALLDEQRCSKYDFEEKVLEKVIRFEIALESAQTKFDVLAEQLMKQQTGLTEERNQLMQEIQSVKDDVVSDVQKLKENVTNDVAAMRTAREEDRDQLLQEFQSVKDDVISDVTALRTAQERNQATAASKFNNLLQKTQDQISRISRDAHGIQNKTDGVSAFTVKVPKAAADTHGVSSVLRFTTTVYDASGDYDVTSGVFTCRHAGVYFFALSLVKLRTGTRVHDQIKGYIYKGSEQLIIAYLDPTDDDTDKGGYETSAFVTTHLVPGDAVFVGGGTGVKGMHSYSAFSGFLLRAG